jgi:hypothetical protein
VIASEGAEFVFRIDVHDAAAATIRLVDGKTIVPWPRPDNDVVERLDDGEAQGLMGSGLGPFQITGARPGRYRIRIPQINGYEPYPPVEFDLVADETTDIVIDLVRSR